MNYIPSLGLANLLYHDVPKQSLHLSEVGGLLAQSIECAASCQEVVCSILASGACSLQVGLMSV